MGHQIFKTDWFWNVDDPKTMNQAILWQSRNAMKYSSSNPAMYFRKLLQLVLLTKKTEAGELQIWAQWWFGSASDRRYETRMRTDKQTFTRRCTTLWARHWWHTSSMTGSGGFTPGTPVSTHKRNEIDEKMVVFPRVLRFPPTKKNWKRDKKRKKEFYFIFDFTFL